MLKIWLPAAVLLACPSWAQIPPALDEALSSARQLVRQGRFQAAAEAFRKILDHAPGSGAYAGLVQSLLKQDDVTAADDASRKGLQALPASALTLAARGDVLFRRGLITDARNQYDAALKLDEQCARAWLGRGKVEAVLARRRSALDAVAKAHQLDPDDGDALYEWAIRQPYPANVAGLEKHLAEFHNDAETEGHERDYLELLKALAGRNVWVLRPEVSRSELKLDLLTTGPNFAHRGYGLRVRFNDHVAATLLVDTGSSGVTITRKFAERIGARKLSDQAILGAGMGSVTHGYQAWVDKIAIGDLAFHNCFVHVVPRAIAETDGLIGTDVFFKFLVTLDFPARKLRLEPIAEAGPNRETSTGDPNSPAQAYGFGHLLLLPTLVDEKVSGLFVIDSGSNVTTLAPGSAKRIGSMRLLNLPTFGISGSANNAQISDRLNLSFAKVRCQDRVITVDLHAISKELGTEVSGQIGFSTLEQMRTTINYRDGTVEFGYR